MNAELNLSGVRNAADLLRRSGGGDVLALLERLGFWVGGDNPVAVDGRKPFRTDVSRLGPDALGDESAYWQSELSRVTSILGALESQKLIAAFDLKRVRNTAAARTLEEARTEERKTPTRDQLSISVEERPEVRSAAERVLMIDVVLAALGAVKEAYEGYCRALSREVTRRGDMARIHR